MPICSHCGKLRAQSTIDKHLRLQPRAVPDESDDSSMEGSGEMGGLGESEDEFGSFEVTGEINDELIILHDVSMQMGDLSIALDVEDAAGFTAHADSDVHSSTGAASINEPLDAITPGPTLRRNPPVTIEEWPDPDAGGSEVSDTFDEPLDSLDRDPEYTEPTDPLPDEPDLTETEYRERFEEELGSIDDEVWSNLYTKVLSKNDLTILRFLATRLRTHFSRQTYDELRLGVCADLKIPSEFITWRRLRILSGIESRTYDCCIGSCCCFVGKYKDLRACPFCKQPRYNAQGKSQRVFRYIPLIPQLIALFQSKEIAYMLGYRARAEKDREPDTVRDVFDSANYQRLRNTRVSPDEPYTFFDFICDLAITLSTDGFTLFKRRRRGWSTAWPLIITILNIDPKYRTHLHNVICLGVIPGPRQAKDIISFLIPLLDELIELAKGIEINGYTPEGEFKSFVLRAFLLIIFGDILAISKLLSLKGHNTSPCRTCYIEGCLCQLRGNSVYYVPHMHPGKTKEWNLSDLPMRHHDDFSRLYQVGGTLSD